MRLARIVGTVVSTIKDPALSGQRLLLLQPVDRRGQPRGRLQLALDCVGAGEGETVYYVRGKEASFPWYPREVPADCTVVGILDPSGFPATTG